MEDRILKPSKIALGTLLVLLVAALLTQTGFAQAPPSPPSIGPSTTQSSGSSIDAPWIWSPRGGDASETYFRKRFTLVKPETAELSVAAGDEFELYINGQMAISGQSFRSATTLDVIDFVSPGVNIIAVKTNHIDSNQAGFCCKLRVKEKGEIRHRVLRTDATWKSYTARAVDWHKNGFRDMSWLSSKVISGQQGPAVVKKAVPLLPTVTTSTTPIFEPAKTASPAQGPKIELVSQAPPVPPSSDVQPSTAKKSTSKHTIDNLIGDSKVVAAAPTNALLDAVAAPTTSEKNNHDFVPPASKPVATDSAQRLAEQLNAAKTSQASKISQNEVTETKVAETKEVASISDAPAPATSTTVAKTLSKPVVEEGRFTTADPYFAVTEVLPGELTGSIIAMEFNEFGKLLLSREGGPLLIADLAVPAGDENQLQIYCDQVSSCQGILPLNGDVYVTAEGPNGQGLYRLSDVNGDGLIEVANTLLQFTGKPSEHGAHGIQLGPDGMLYVAIGNGSRLKNTPAATSPYQFTYEGDVVAKYEDPTGQATDVKAPGGTIVRVAIDGSKVETVAGGIRNAYDLVFDANGELFIHDSDMEGDLGTTWYRPPMVFNVTAGADLGWRSGSSKFAMHQLDQTPMVCQTGRGSPSGAAVYQHLQFPTEYQNAIFLADWSEGKIMTLQKKRQGASFVGQTKDFLTGRPMNVCDLSVGEDGSLYFCTGGRGTSGGVYRVSWTGEIPEKVLTFKDELAKIIRHPQPTAAWARQNIAELRRELGDRWDDSILGIVQELQNPPRFRVRAIQMMVWYGPKPTPELMRTLLDDENEDVRSAAITLCETQPNARTRKYLLSKLNDPSPIVRRRSAEGLLRFETPVDVAQIIHLLKSNDPVEALAGRQLLQRVPSETWKENLINSNDQRIFIQSALALMAAAPSLEHAYDVLAQSSRLSESFVSDENFIDMLRVMQVALAQGNVDPAKVPALAQRMGNEFPTGNPLINIELVKILGALKVGNLDGRIESFLANEEISQAEKFQTAFMLQHAGEGLNKSERMAIIETLEELKSFQGGGSYRGYLELASQDASSTVDMKDLDSVIAGGDRWPEAVLASFGKMAIPLPPSHASALMELDQKLIDRTDLSARQVRLGIIAILARERNDGYMKYLRQCWDSEEGRRVDLAIGLAQQPDGDNWSYLVASLPLLDDLTAKDVLQTLANVGRRPRDPFFYRTTIELGFRLRQQGSDAAVELLEHWTGQQMVTENRSWRSQLVKWGQWYQQTYPNATAIVLEPPTTKGRYSTDQIAAFVETNGLGDPLSGHDLFAAAQCSSCHQFNGTGQGIGPELTSIANRFSIREMIEATIDPHKSVAPRYRAQTLLTDSGQQITGLVIDEKERPLMVMTPDGRRITVERNEVENIRTSELSHMPERLLDNLSLSQISDLFAYLTHGRQGSRNNMADRNSAHTTNRNTVIR